MNQRYTKELLEEVVRKSCSVQHVMRNLGLKLAGGTHSHISKKIRKFEIDTSHFIEQGLNAGEHHKGGPDKLHFSAILVYDRRNGLKERTSRLRNALIEAGVPHKCAVCNSDPEWLGKPLTLQIDHANGDNLDNSPENVRFLCPNCHSQTETFNKRK